MKELDWVEIVLEICWKLFSIIWICTAYISIMYSGHILYDVIFNNVEYSKTELFLVALCFPFATGMIQGYYESKGRDEIEDIYKKEKIDKGE